MTAIWRGWNINIQTNRFFKTLWVINIWIFIIKMRWSREIMDVYVVVKKGTQLQCGIIIMWSIVSKSWEKTPHSSPMRVRYGVSVVILISDSLSVTVITMSSEKSWWITQHYNCTWLHHSVLLNLTINSCWSSGWITFCPNHLYWFWLRAWNLLYSLWALWHEINRDKSGEITAVWWGWDMNIYLVSALIGTVWCCNNTINFPIDIYKRHPIAHPLGWGMGCLLWFQPLIDIGPQFLQWCLQYLVILDCVIVALDSSF